MKKIIIRLALATLLGVPTLSLVITLLPMERSKVIQMYSIAFPGDAEDQADDSTSSEDSEGFRDSELISANLSIILLPVQLEQHVVRQEQHFREHHREVVTPPPRHA